MRGGYSASATSADISSDKVPEHAGRILDGWRTVKAFAARHYPCASITVVRPVGLRGMGFREIDHNPDV